MIYRKLVRTRNGTMIHRANCKQMLGKVKYLTPWDWADDKSRTEILAAAIYFGYNTCLHCLPLQSEDDKIGVTK